MFWQIFCVSAVFVSYLTCCLWAYGIENVAVSDVSSDIVLFSVKADVWEIFLENHCWKLQDIAVNSVIKILYVAFNIYATV